MASISSPLQASLQTINVTATTVARQVISGAGGYGGGGAGGGGGAVAPASSGPDPQTLAIVKAEQGAIVSLREELDGLVKRDNDFISKIPSLIDLQKQIDIISGRIDYLGAQLLPIGQLIQNESFLEQQKDRQEYENERRLAEQGLRAGKEKLLEQRIQNALMAPIRAIGNKASSIFGSLMNFMWTLLGGWLTMQGLNALKAYASGDKKKLEEIKNNVIKSLFVVGGILGVMQFGIFRTIGLITKLGLKVGKFVLENTIGKLFGALVKIGKGLLGKGTEAAAETTAKAAGKTALEEGGKVAEKGVVEGAEKVGAKGLAEGAAKFGSRIAPVLGASASSYFAVEDLKKGNLPGAGLNAISAGADLLGQSEISLFTTLGAMGTEINYKGDKKDKPQQTPPKAQTKPKTPATPPKSSLTSPAASATAAASSTPDSSMSSTQSSTPNSTSDVTVSQQPSTPPAPPSPAQTQGVPTAPANLGNMAEPKPNVVMLGGSNQNQQQSQTPQSSLQSGSATDVPLFASANPDNFYSLYAQVNYNVIL